MKTTFAIASSIALLAGTHATDANTLNRQLQNFPPSNNQGPFRPAPMAPNGMQGQFGGIPFQGNGLGPGPVPMNGQGTIGQEASTQDLETGARESDETASSVVEAETGAPGTADASVPTTPVVATPPGDISPGQPTIMVIVPDFLAAGSGWSSLSGEVGETKTPSSEKPKETEEPKSSAAEKKAGSLRQLTFLVTFAAMLGFSGFTGTAN